MARIAAITVVASSGREVPTATSVRPITVSLTPGHRARSMELSTSRSAPSGKADQAEGTR
jgi:hypothetical protein